MQIILIIILILAVAVAFFAFLQGSKKKDSKYELGKLAIEKGGIGAGGDVVFGNNKKTTKTTNIKMGSISILFALAAAATLYFNPFGIVDGNYPIPDGTYEMVSEISLDTLGLGFTEFNVKGSTITVSYMAGMGGVDYTYKVDENQIKLTAQGGTISYPFEKKDSSHFIINGAEYVKKK